MVGDYKEVCCVGRCSSGERHGGTRSIHRTSFCGLTQCRWKLFHPLCNFSILYSSSYLFLKNLMFILHSYWQAVYIWCHLLRHLSWGTSQWLGSVVTSLVLCWMTGNQCLISGSGTNNSPWHTGLLWIPPILQSTSTKVKAARVWSWHSSPSSAKVKNLDKCPLPHMSSWCVTLPPPSDWFLRYRPSLITENCVKLTGY